MKEILLRLASSLSLAAADETKCFVHLIFNSILHLVNGVLCDLQNLLRYFNGTAIVVFLKFPLTPSASVFPNILALYLKGLKSSVFEISASKLIASSFE